MRCPMVDTPIDGMRYAWVWSHDKSHVKNAKFFKILAICLFLLVAGMNIRRIVSGEIPNIFSMSVGLIMPVLLYCLQTTRTKIRKQMWVNAINAYGLSEEERGILINSYKLRFNEEPYIDEFRRGLLL